MRAEETGKLVNTEDLNWILRTFILVCVSMCVYAHTHINVYMYIHMYMCTYTYKIFVYTYGYMHMPGIVTHLQSLYWGSRDKDSGSLALPSWWVLDPWETLLQGNQWLVKDTWSYPLASTSLHAQVCSPAHINENDSYIYMHTRLYIYTHSTHTYIYIS